MMKLAKFFVSLSIAAGTLFSGAAHADDWGCQVLLCLSNPAGPMAVSECVPPITRLYQAIFKPNPDPFPTCTMSNGSDSRSGGSYANVAAPNYYDACPSGTTALAPGLNAVQGARGQYNYSAQMGVGIGDGTGVQPDYSNNQSLPSKICVGNQVDFYNNSTGSGDNQQSVTVGVYDRVVFIDPAATPFLINVYINNALYRAVRPKF
jgi:hypothetical protein